MPNLTIYYEPANSFSYTTVKKPIVSLRFIRTAAIVHHIGVWRYGKYAIYADVYASKGMFTRAFNRATDRYLLTDDYHIPKSFKYLVKR